MVRSDLPAPRGTDCQHLEHRGCRLAYRVSGQGPKVLLIQGTGLHGDGWRPQVDELAKRYRCLSFDNRGIGASHPFGAPITVEQMAEDALVLMDAQGWDSAHLVGHSLGGLVALHLALSARVRVRSLSLLCTFARGRDATRLSWGSFWLGLRTYLGTRRMRRRAFTQLVLPPALLADRDAWADRLAPIFGHDLADHPPAVMKQLAAMRAYDATPHLHKLAGLPTLVVGARHDRIATPDIVRALASGIADSRLVEFDDAAHGVTIQCADKVNLLLHEHFSQAETNDLPPKHGSPDSSSMSENSNVTSLISEAKALCEAVWNDQSLRDKNYSAAIALLKSVLSLDPENVAALTNLGGALSDSGEHQEALKLLQRAEAIGSADRNLYFNLAVAMMNSGKHTRSQAQPMFEKASRLSPRNDTFEAYFDPHGH